MLKNKVRRWLRPPPARSARYRFFIKLIESFLLLNFSLDFSPSKDDTSNTISSQFPCVLLPRNSAPASFYLDFLQVSNTKVVNKTFPEKFDFFYIFHLFSFFKTFSRELIPAYCMHM